MQTPAVQMNSREFMMLMLIDNTYTIHSLLSLQFCMTALMCASSYLDYFAHRSDAALCLAGESMSLCLQLDQERKENMLAVIQELQKVGQVRFTHQTTQRKQLSRVGSFGRSHIPWLLLIVFIGVVHTLICMVVLLEYSSSRDIFPVVATHSSLAVYVFCLACSSLFSCGG